MSDCVWERCFINITSPGELPPELISIIDIDLVYDSMFEYYEQVVISFQTRMYQSTLHVSVRQVQNLHAILSIQRPGCFVRLLSERDALARRRIYPN